MANDNYKRCNTCLRVFRDDPKDSDYMYLVESLPAEIPISSLKVFECGQLDCHDPKDGDRCRFLRTKAHQLHDLCSSDAKLIDDISENGDRHLKPGERRRCDELMQDFQKRRLK